MTFGELAAQGHGAEHPARALGSDAAEALAGASAPVIAALAGRDSIAALISAVRTHSFDVVVPSVVLTQTEKGDARAPLKALEVARTALAGETTITEPVWLTSPALFSALNVRYAEVLSSRYASWCVCSACHLYVNLCRLPLSRMLGGVPIISGDRDSHDGRIKPSQTPEVIDAMTAVLAHAGVSLLEPLREATGAQIEELLGGKRWAEGKAQLVCEHSGGADIKAATARYEADEQSRLAREYLIPAGIAVADAWLAAPEPDYEEIVAQVLGLAHAE